ncbi:Crp/Fnr family transcriptional regulator [Candidatus Nitrospira bockiana]
MADPLRAIPLFDFVKGADRRRLAADVIETRYRKGEFIFREGDPTEYFHVVKEGAVKCVKTSPEGKEVTLKVLLPGDLFCCEAAVFDGTPHPGCAQPMGDVSVLRLKKTDYFDLLRRNPEAALEVIKYLGNRLHEAQEQAKVLALETAEQRLAGLFVNLVKRSGIRDGNGYRLNVRLTRHDLANMVGITTETAIRIMGRFKRARLVSGTAKQLVVLDLPRLQALASASGLVPVL